MIYVQGLRLKGLLEKARRRAASRFSRRVLWFRVYSPMVLEIPGLFSSLYYIILI